MKEKKKNPLKVSRAWKYFPRDGRLTLVAQLVSNPWNHSGCSSLLLNAVFESSLFKALFRTATFALRFSVRNSDAFSPAIRKSMLTRLKVSYRRSASARQRTDRVRLCSKRHVSPGSPFNLACSSVKLWTTSQHGEIYTLCLWNDDITRSTQYFLIITDKKFSIKVFKCILRELQ